MNHVTEGSAILFLCQVDNPHLRPRLTALGQQRRAVRESLDRARQQATTAGASEMDGDAIARACREALRGVGQVTPEARRRLLQLLVHEVTILHGGADLALDGWLPTGRELTAASPSPGQFQGGSRYHLVLALEPA
jgi:hypothetical protein